MSSAGSRSGTATGCAGTATRSSAPRCGARAPRGAARPPGARRWRSDGRRAPQVPVRSCLPSRVGGDVAGEGQVTEAKADPPAEVDAGQDYEKPEERTKAVTAPPQQRGQQHDDDV